MSAAYTYAVPPAATISARTSSSFSTLRATSSGTPPAAATFSAVARPMPEEAPVISTCLPVERLLQRAPAAEVGVHLALPVVPQPRRVVVQRRRLLERRAGERALRSRACRSAAPAPCARAPPRGCRARAARGCAAWRQGGSASASDSGHFGSGSVRRLSTLTAKRGACAARGELVDQLVDALRARVGEVEGAAVEVGLVRDVLERGRHPVDRHDVRVAEVEADQRHPLGQQLAHRAGSP